MKRLFKRIAAIAMTVMCFPLAVQTAGAAGTDDKKPQTINALYVGVRDYGKMTPEKVKAPDFDGFMFLVDGEEEPRCYKIKADEDFSIQNVLQEYRTYEITVEGDTVTGAKLLYPDELKIDYVPPVKGTPGLKTLKNFLATAFEPVGTTLYVFGGAWTWQDSRSPGPQALTIGVPDEWKYFFDLEDADYNYRYVPRTNNKKEDPDESIYHSGGWNQYYYLGADCAGYVEWCVFNLMHTENGSIADKEYYIGGNKQSKTYAENNHYGTFTNKPVVGNEDTNALLPGDIFSMDGHIWICLGTCKDGSIVILHSTPSKSRTNEMGGGPQMSALDPKGRGNDCDAWKLADYYSKKYFPEWSRRYEVITRDYADYTSLGENPDGGRFSWAVDGSVLTDPDGYRNMTAEQILSDLFNDPGPDAEKKK